MPLHKKDLDELLHANVISPDTAQAIHNYYKGKKATASNPLLAIFGALGGVLVGLGIILIFAHNWDNFSRTVKTFLAFTPLVVSQAFAAWYIIKNKTPVFKETAAVLIFFAVGASISLVAQVYNISGDFPQFLLTWAVLCAPLMYLLRSNAAVVLHLIISTAYVINKGYWDYPNEDPYWYLLLMAVFIPYYYRLIKQDAEGRMALTLHILVPASLIIASNAFFSHTGDFSFLLFVVFFGLFYLIGTLPQLRRIYKIVGVCGLMVVLFAGSFNDTWARMDTSNAPLGYVIAFGLMLAAIMGLVYRNVKQKDTDPVQFVTFAILLIYMASLASNGFAAILANLLALATGLWYTKKGIDEVKYLTVNFGLLIITILAGCRFFDTDLSFVVRGLLFVGVGLGFFAANYAVSKRKQQSEKTEPYEN